MPAADLVSFGDLTSLCMFDGLDSVPWSRLRHAYGKAVDAPNWIRALNSDEEDNRTEAINYFLWSSVFHQGTVYTATPFVIPFIIEGLGSTVLAERDDGLGNPMKRELLRFIRLCAERGQRAISGWRTWPAPAGTTIEEAVLVGRPTYEFYANDPHEQVARDAQWLLKFCDEHTRVTEKEG